LYDVAAKLRKCICIVLGAEVRRQFSVEEEDELLQFAIQQSLIEAGSEKDEVPIQSILEWLCMLHVSDTSLDSLVFVLWSCN